MQRNLRLPASIGDKATSLFEGEKAIDADFGIAFVRVVGPVNEPAVNCLAQDRQREADRKAVQDRH